MEADCNLPLARDKQQDQGDVAKATRKCSPKMLLIEINTLFGLKRVLFLSKEHISCIVTTETNYNMVSTVI